MIFGRKKQHKLPKFPATLIPAFKALCQTLPGDEIKKFPGYIDQKLEELSKEAEHNYRVNVILAEQIAERCRFLITIYDQQPPANQALIVGAIRYFAIGDDAVNEEAFASGMDDDAKVVNYVLEEIGIMDRFVDLSF